MWWSGYPDRSHHALGLHRIELAPGSESSALHVHHEEDEAVYVLAGTGTVWLDDAAHEVGAGDLLAHPAGAEAHKLVNTGTEPLICLVVGERRAHDICDYPLAGRRMDRHRGEEDVVARDAIGSKRPR